VSKQDEYAELRNVNKKLDALGQAEAEAVAAVKARFRVKWETLRARRAALLTAVKGEEPPKTVNAVANSEAIGNSGAVQQ
jgi:hypothetical protein